MLSVLIPVYGYAVGPLATDLVRQLNDSGLTWELRIYEDGPGSPSTEANAFLAEHHARLVYRLMPRNHGRAAIRNRLATEARYANLLFLDADGEIPAGFIHAYRPYLGGEAVVSGGRRYRPQDGSDSEYRLHWEYGRERESLPAARRNRHPYQGFQTNNFLAPRNLLAQHPFEAADRAYGHEDTLWGWQLRDRGVPIVHLDNAVAHLGLEPAAVFLEKQRVAVESLRKLERQHPGLPTRLGAFARRYGWARAVLVPILRSLVAPARRRLLAWRPGNLLWLDALKLYWYWTLGKD